MAGTSNSVSSPIVRHEQALLVDKRNMMILWAEERVARHEMTPAEAHKMLDEQENKSKLWISPLKDAGGGINTFVKIAKDFASWKGAGSSS